MSDLLMQRVGQIEARVGAAVPFRADPSGAGVMTQGHGPYREAVRNGSTCSAARPAGVWTKLAAIATGLILSTPIGSGTVLSILSAECAQSSAAATATSVVSLAAFVDSQFAVPTAPTAIAVRNALLGG